jgi:hypothetical protein
MAWMNWESWVHPVSSFVGGVRVIFGWRREFSRCAFFRPPCASSRVSRPFRAIAKPIEVFGPTCHPWWGAGLYCLKVLVIRMCSGRPGPCARLAALPPCARESRGLAGQVEAKPGVAASPDGALARAAPHRRAPPVARRPAGRGPRPRV